MSRSFKKHPGWTDNSDAKTDKRLANKRVRKHLDIPSGNAYKKLYETWDIHDWKYIYFSEKDLQEDYGNESYKARMK